MLLVDIYDRSADRFTFVVLLKIVGDHVCCGLHQQSERYHRVFKFL